jgi:hypothetical protein
MIQSIGMKKFILILILAVFAVGGYFYNSSIFASQITKEERQNRQVKSKLSKIKKDTDDLVAGLVKFEKQKEVFSFIDDAGFFDDQNRVVARRRIEAMQAEANLKTFRYSLSPAETISDEALSKTGYKILNSNLELNLGAVDDTDIYSFVYMLSHGFPGQVIISDVSIKKEQNITQPLLRNIGVNADYDPLVTAVINAQWQTMVPDDSFVEVQEGN